MILSSKVQKHPQSHTARRPDRGLPSRWRRRKAGEGDRADHFPPSLDPLTDSANTDSTSHYLPLALLAPLCPMVVRYDNGTGGGRTDFDRPLSFMRIGVDIHREFEETAAFRSLVAKRETSPLCKWERRLLRITTCDTRRGRGWGASSVSEAWRSGCGENPISSLLSLLPANGTKAQKSIYPWNGKRAGVRVTGQV